MPYVAPPAGSARSACRRTGGRTPATSAADDAVRMLGDVLAESLAQLERVLHTVSVVVDVAAADYARAEARCVGR